MRKYPALQAYKVGVDDGARTDGVTLTRLLR
jgi:hypothetical protein